MSICVHYLNIYNASTLLYPSDLQSQVSIGLYYILSSLFLVGITCTYICLFSLVKFLLLLCKYLVRSSACDNTTADGEMTDETQGRLDRQRK